MPSLMATIGLNAGGLNAVAAQVKGTVGKLGASVAGSFRGMGGQIAAAFTVGTITHQVKKALDLGGAVQDLSNRLGISTDAVQQWDYALKQNGSSIDKAAPFFEKLGESRERALSGDEKAIENFRRLGVSLDMLKSKRVEDIAASIAKAFESGDVQSLITPLREVGGRGGGEMAAAFVDGLHDALGDAPIVNPEDIAKLDAIADKLGAIQAEQQTAMATLVAGTAEYGLTAIDLVLRMVKGQVEGLSEVFAQLQTMGGVDLAALANPMLAGNTVAKLGVDFIKAGGRKAGQEAARQQVRDEEIAKKREEAQAKKKSGLFDFDSVEEQKEREKAEADAQKQARKDAEKEAIFHKDRYDLEQKEKEKEELENAKLNKHSVSSLQQSGGFLGNFSAAGIQNASPELAVHQKNERHLSEAVRLLKVLSKGGTPGREETEY